MSEPELNDIWASEVVKLRDERDRLRRALEIANETIHYYSMTAISARAVGAKEAIKAALTPAGGGQE